VVVSVESEAALIDPTTVFDNARQRLVTDAGPRPPTNPASTPRYANNYASKSSTIKAKSLAAVTNGVLRLQIPSGF
jgi:hypothetical protein